MHVQKNAGFYLTARSPLIVQLELISECMDTLSLLVRTLAPYRTHAFKKQAQQHKPGTALLWRRRQKVLGTNLAEPTRDPFSKTKVEVN